MLKVSIPTIAHRHGFAENDASDDRARNYLVGSGSASIGMEMRSVSAGSQKIIISARTR